MNKLVTHFLANTISPVYCHLIKDRLYCDEATSPTRLAAVEVTRETLTVFARSIAPIVPHLAEEAWLHHPINLGKRFRRQNLFHQRVILFVYYLLLFTASVPLYHTEYKVPETWNQPEIAAHVERALDLRTIVNILAEQNTWELSGTVTASKNDYESLSVSYLLP